MQTTDRIASPVTGWPRALPILLLLVILSFLATGETRSQTSPTIDSARALIAAGRTVEAGKFLRDAIDREGESASLLRLLGDAGAVSGNFEEAIEWYSKAARLTDCDTCHADLDSLASFSLRAGKLDDAEEQARRAKSRRSPVADATLAAVCHARGAELITRHDLEGALSRYREGLKIHEDTAGYAGLLRCYFLLHRKEEYLKLAESLLPRYPAFQGAKDYLCAYYLTAGRELETVGMDSSALGVYGLCLETDPSRAAEAALAIGRVWLKLRDTARALEYYSNASADERFATEGTREGAKIYAARKQFREAILLLQNGISRYPADHAAWSDLAGYLLDAGMRWEAIEADRISAKLGNKASEQRLRANYLATEPVNVARFRWLTEDPFAQTWKDPARFAGRVDPPDFIPVDVQPVPIFQANPDYPEVARRAGIEGTIWVKLLVDRSGIVVKAVVMKSDNSIFEESALRAGLQWRFRPARLDGEPIAVWAAVPFRFKLNR